jgi:hypothetical protein
VQGISNYQLDRYLWNRSRGLERFNLMQTYQGEVTFTAAPQDQVTAVNIDTDAPFAWCGLRGAGFAPALGIPAGFPEAAIMVRYGGPGAKGFANTPVELINCMATRPVPFMLPSVKVLDAGSQLSVTVTLRSGAVFPFGVSFQFFGFKPFSRARA